MTLLLKTRFWTICTLRTTTDIKADTNFPHNKPSQKCKIAVFYLMSTWNDKITSANFLVDLKSSPPFYCNNRVAMLRMFPSKVQSQAFFQHCKTQVQHTQSQTHTRSQSRERAARERLPTGERWISCVPCCWNPSSEWGKVRKQYFISILLHNKADEKDHNTKSSCHGNLTDQKCHMLTGWSGAFIAQPSDSGTWLLCNFAKELLRAWNHCI